MISFYHESDVLTEQKSSEIDVPLESVAQFLLAKKDLLEVVSQGLRQSFDEVIDGARTGRYSIDQLEKTEKTYIGTKVEIILRHKLSLKRGIKLDNLICDHEVDTKFSLTGNWMIPSEAIDHLCILVSGSDKSEKFSIGLLRMTLDNLTPGENRDKKRHVSAAGKKRIYWLIQNTQMIPNFLMKLPDPTRELILSKTSGVQRMKALFTNVTEQLIPRIAIEQVAQQKDPLKRAREMKDILIKEGYRVLCATYEIDKKHFISNGFPSHKDDDWLSLKL
jgi:hypothetical protein